jgi:O-antigen ligase
VEDNQYLAERAIGVWVDPNAFGGVLAVLGALIAPQIFAARPLGGRRWLTAAILGVLLIALLLTYSRGALMSLGAAMAFVAVMRYRKLLWVMVAVGILIMLLPMTQSYVLRFVEGLQGADLATQMRFGEIRDSLTLIGRYPFFGVGFSGTPTRDIYLGVANLYLAMASNTGLIGLGTFLIAIVGFFAYGMRAWKRVGRPARFESIWLGTFAGVVAALAAGVFDHYFFKLEFQASGTLFWLVIGLALSVSRFWLDAEVESVSAV